MKLKPLKPLFKLSKMPVPLPKPSLKKLMLPLLLSSKPPLKSSKMQLTMLPLVLRTLPFKLSKPSKQSLKRPEKLMPPLQLPSLMELDIS